MRRLVPIIVSILFIGVGIFCLTQANGLKKRCTVEAQATVIEIVREESNDPDDFGSYTYYPVIRYQAGEQTVTKKSIDGSNPSRYSENDTIDILYNPDNVEEFIIAGDNSVTIIGIIAIVVGGLLFVISIWKMLIGR